jgi:GDP-4-dehydro-6-deoxy-D-mannose reductase
MGIVRSGPTPAGAPLTQCDLVAESAKLVDIVRGTAPQAIVHLAGTNGTRSDPWELFASNVRPVLNLLTACRLAAPRARIAIVSSGAVYGYGPAGAPLREQRRPAPITPYGVSKLAAETAALQHWRAYRVPVVVVRPFNVTGPGEPDSFVTSAFARQVALIERREQPAVIRVGNLDTVRDFVDVRDVAEAVVRVAESGRPGQIYNVCSGLGATPADILAILARLSTVPVTVEQDPGRMRAVDIRSQVGDPAKIRGVVRWHTSYPLERTVLDVLEQWRARAAGAAAAC